MPQHGYEGPHTLVGYGRVRRIHDDKSQAEEAESTLHGKKQRTTPVRDTDVPSFQGKTKLKENEALLWDARAHRIPASQPQFLTVHGIPNSSTTDVGLGLTPLNNVARSRWYRQ